ncbi:MAG: DNA-processing protein DprA, partial [Mycoplasmataceae bacterium]|nr:DNA-processing protein DprA [Mycoplasmataceae bacterium]
MENINNKIAIKYLALRDWAKKNGISTRTFLKEIRLLNSVKLFLDNKIIEFFGDKHDIFGSKISKYKIEDLEFLMKRYSVVFDTYLITAIPIEDYGKYSLLKNFGSKSILIYIRGKQENIMKILNNNIDQSFAIVGSRKTPEIYSKWIEERMPDKNVVISGLANGADLIGHRVAIKSKKLIVVFPGFNIDWNPPVNKMDVFNEAVNNGLVISSIPPLA